MCGVAGHRTGQLMNSVSIHYIALVTGSLGVFLVQSTTLQKCLHPKKKKTDWFITKLKCNIYMVDSPQKSSTFSLKIQVLHVNHQQSPHT